jgi:hypothetical protein
MQPIRYENELPVFTSDQIDIYGEPDETIYPRYMVVEGPPIYEVGFVEKQQTTLKKIHRYDRRARFKLQLQKILGCSPISRNRIGPTLILIECYIEKDDPERYEKVQRMLLHYKLNRLLPYIPTILRMAGKDPLIDVKCPSEMLELLMDDFKFFEINFFQAKDIRQERKYMLNMKYLAYKLLQKRGIEVTFPLLRTKRKIKVLDDIFNKVITR